ncbi:MAG: hypothetical protein IPN29_11560 [Saprospiraceae bacterium]|nr:hypothetical protein [Saprospiraceae bacterium]
MKKIFGFHYILICLIFITVAVSCNDTSPIGNDDRIALTEENDTCTFENITQGQIDTFIIAGYEFAIAALRDSQYGSHYQTLLAMDPKRITFMVDTMTFDTTIMQVPYFATIANLAKDNQTLQNCLSQRAIDLGMVDYLEREVGGNDSRRCSFWYVAGQMTLALISVGEASTGFGLILGVVGAAGSLYNIYCCWHC